MVRFNVPVRLRENQNVLKTNGGGYSRPLDSLVLIQIHIDLCTIFVLQEETRTSVLPEQIQYYLQLAQQQANQTSTGQATPQIQTSQIVTQPTTAAVQQVQLAGKFGWYGPGWELKHGQSQHSLKYHH